MFENKYEVSDFSVLMVDDLPKNLQVLGNILKSKNYLVEFATNGESALKWLEKRDFDLVLLDLMMPGMNGFEVCQHIREIKRLDDMPIIFLTAKVDKESIVKGFEVGGQDYVTKPFDSSELLARVKTHLELKKSKQKLSELNSWLEKKVKERTEELNITNKNLTKANQQLKLLSEQLISLDKEKAEFLQIISHEIRTPLNAIKGFLGLVKSKVREEKVLDYFNYIDDASYRLEKFSIQALLFTELRTKKYPVKKEKIIIKEILNDTISQKFSQAFSSKGLNYKYDLLPENAGVMVDKRLFDICLSNIIGNAISYSNLGGEIIFKAYPKNNNVIFEIHDEGPGFSAKALSSHNKLFVLGTDGFSQGKGIDLAIVGLIMENHNGRLEVVNKEQGGAIVKLFFPNLI